MAAAPQCPESNRNHTHTWKPVVEGVPAVSGTGRPLFSICVYLRSSAVSWFLRVLEREVDLLRGDRQIVDAYPTRVGNGVGDGRRHSADAAFTDRLGTEWSRSHRILEEHGGKRRNVGYRRKLCLAQIQRADPAALGR